MHVIMHAKVSFHLDPGRRWINSCYPLIWPWISAFFTDSPRVTESRATPHPVTPPPITSTSNTSLSCSAWTCFSLASTRHHATSDSKHIATHTLKVPGALSSVSELALQHAPQTDWVTVHPVTTTRNLVIEYTHHLHSLFTLLRNALNPPYPTAPATSKPAIRVRRCAIPSYRHVLVVVLVLVSRQPLMTRFFTIVRTRTYRKKITYLRDYIE